MLTIVRLRQATIAVFFLLALLLETTVNVAVAPALFGVLVLWFAAVTAFGHAVGRWSFSRHLHRAFFGLLILELALIGVVFNLTGGIGWVGFLGFIFVILTAAFTIDLRATYLIAGLASATVTVMTLAEFAGWLPSHPMFPTAMAYQDLHANDAYVATTAATIAIGFIPSVALFIRFGATELHRRQRSLQEANRSLSKARADAIRTRERLEELNVSLEERIEAKTAELERRNERMQRQSQVSNLLMQVRTAADVVPVIREILDVAGFDGLQGYVRWSDEAQTPEVVIWSSSARPEGDASVAIRSSVLEQVEKTGRWIICEDVDAPPGSETIVEPGSPVRGYAIAPLVAKGRVVGAFAALALTPTEWTEEKLEKFAEIGSETATTLENLYLRIEQQEEARRAQILAEIAKVLSSSIELEECFRAFAAHVTTVLGIDRVALYEIDETDARIRFVAQEGGTAVGEGTRVQLTGIMERAIKGGEPLFGRQDELPAELSEQLVREGLRSCMVAPLGTGERAIGLLVLASRSEGGGSLGQRRFLQQISTLFSQAWKNSLLYEQSEERARELETLANIGTIVNSSLDLSDVHTAFARELHRLIPFDVLTVALPYDDRPTMRCLYARYEDDTFISEWLDMDKENTLMWWVIENERRALFTDIEAELFFHERGFLVRNGHRYAACVPLFAKGRAVGSLSIGSRATPYSSTHLDLMEKLVEPLGLAAENVTLFAEANERARRITALGNIARAVSSSRQVQSVYSEVVTQLETVLRFDEAVIAVAHEDVIETYTVRPGYLGVGDPSTNDLYADDALRQETSACVVNDSELARLSHIDRAIWRAGYRSSLRVPIYIKGAWAGVLMLNAVGPSAFRSEHIEVLEEVAHLVGAAVESASLYEELRRHAETDPLTGLANHRSMEAALEREAARSRRTQRPFSLLVVDIDNFKVFNDMLGHQAGDRVLRDMSRFLDSVRRDVDVAARMGGDEFYVLLPETPESGALEVADRVRRSAHESGVRYPGQGVAITLSIGVATFPTHGEGVAEVVRVADAAMYDVKRAGGNGVRAGRAEASAHAGRTVSFGLLEMLATTIAARTDRLPHVPAETSAQVATAIADEMGLSEEERRALRIAAETHRLGLFSEPFDAAEWENMATDERRRYLQEMEVGRLFIRGTPIVQSVLDAAFYHHRGYDDTEPDGEYAAAPPILARVLAVAEAFTALTVNDGLAAEEAVIRLRGAEQGSFDPVVVEALRGLIVRETGPDERVA